MNTTTWFIFAILILMIIGIVSNTGATASENMQDQIFLMNCPLPTFSVLPTLTDVNDFGVTYTIDYNATAHANKVVVFECTVDVDHNKGANTIVYTPTEGFFSLFDNAFAWLGYAYSTITASFQKLGAFLTMITFLITPINFDILGYTINDIGGIGLMVVVGLYIFSYVGIAVFIAPFIIALISGMRP